MEYKAKSDYLDDPVLVEKFNKNYLGNLNIYLDDNNFNQKISQLPTVKSTMTTKFEKIIDREKEMKKLKKTNERTFGEIREKANKKSSIVATTNNLKPVAMRYLILDNEDRHIDLNNIEENFEFNKKLTNPYKVLLLEESDKIKRQAIEQILENAMSNEKKKEKNKLSLIANDVKFLINKYSESHLNKKLTHEEIMSKEAFDAFMKIFNESCDLNNLITVHQKIDYFVYLRNNLQLKKDSPETTLKYKNQNTAHPRLSVKRAHKLSDASNSSNSLINILNNQSSPPVTDNKQVDRDRANLNRSRSLNLEIFNRYISELKTKFKITEDASSIKAWEIYYNEMIIKIDNFKNQYKNLEDVTYIDKIKHIINCKEITKEKIILRDCELTHDRFYFLLAKKVFDFGLLQHLNLSRNLLGDIGGSYLLFLIDTYSTKLEYLNISYNKLGKQSSEYLTSILLKNAVKLHSLSIGGNNFGDKNFSEICVGFSKNSHLAKLYTNDNELGKISATILGTILRYDKKLKVLDVSKNYFDDNNICYLLKGLISNVSLEILYINESNLSNRALRNFETTLSINTSLKEIFVERNKFTNQSFETIAKIFNKNKYVEYISLAGNKLKSEVMDKVIDLQKKLPPKIISKTDYYKTKINSDENINFYEFI